MLGIAAAYGLTSPLASLPYGVGARDLPTFMTVSAALAGVAFAACYIPGRRAARVDPLVALRYE